MLTVQFPRDVTLKLGNALVFPRDVTLKLGNALVDVKLDGKGPFVMKVRHE